MGRREKEIWKQLEDESIKPIYLISSCGNIKNIKGKYIKPFIDNDGYLRATLQGYHNKVKKYVHVLVASHFIDGDSNMQVNHKDFNKKNNYYKNLEWLSQYDNIKHSIRGKRQMVLSCEAHGMSRLRNDEVEIICDKLAKGFRIRDILIDMNLKPKTVEYERMRSIITHIKSGKTWKPISTKYNINKI